jgi:signal transduction histidine kinase
VPPVIQISAKRLDEEEMQKLDLLPAKSYYQIECADNGIGFDQEHAAKMFTIFQQLNDRAQYEGYGIGLALCKKIAENHGGLIEATGVPGKGARFTIVLPVTQ